MDDEPALFVLYFVSSGASCPGVGMVDESREEAANMHHPARIALAGRTCLPPGMLRLPGG